MGRCGYVPPRRLGDVLLRRRWVFHLTRTCDVTGKKRETVLWRRHDVLLPFSFILSPFTYNAIQCYLIHLYSSRFIICPLFLILGKLLLEEKQLNAGS